MIIPPKLDFDHLPVPQAFNDPEVKKQMVAVKYRREQTETRLAGINQVPIKGLGEFGVDRGLAVEVYAGTGGLTKVYKENGFNVITNDINKDSPALHHFDAIKFVQYIMKWSRDCDHKIDLIDFDAYGCPAYAIQEFFKDATRHAPFVLCFSDGFALWMKRYGKKKPEIIEKHYLLKPGSVDTTGIWNHHHQLIDQFMTELGMRSKLVPTRIKTMQTKHKNYVLGAYKFENY